jgi:hypothetical protein
MPTKKYRYLVNDLAEVPNSLPLYIGRAAKAEIGPVSHCDEIATNKKNRVLP